jgi:hypothetical protein
MTVNWNVLVIYLRLFTVCALKTTSRIHYRQGMRRISVALNWKTYVQL